MPAPLNPCETEWRTSLADLWANYGASFSVASSPEKGLDREGQFGAPGSYEAPVMTIFENITKWLCEGVAFANMVDFAGGASADFCNSRIRCVQKGTDTSTQVLFCDRDFDADLTDAFPGTQQNGQAKFSLAVEHSMWFAYWRGQVAGGIKSALISQSDAVLPSLQRQIELEGPYYEFGRKKVRLHVIVSVDGGPVTQVEKAHLPSIARQVKGDLLRRKYGWSKHAVIVWAHFPSIMDVIQSMDGACNLAYDFSPERTFAKDNQRKPTTFKVGNATRHSSSSMLSVPVSEMMENVSNAGYIVSALISASGRGDADTIKFILQRSAELIDKRNENGVTALIWACKKGSVDSVKALVEHKADVNVCSGNKKSPLRYASTSAEPNTTIIKYLIMAKAETDGLFDPIESRKNLMLLDSEYTVEYMRGANAPCLAYNRQVQNMNREMANVKPILEQLFKGNARRLTELLMDVASD